jgi:pyruvate,water dikinase
MGDTDHARRLRELDGGDGDVVGGKAANLGVLATLDVPVLPGFATTADAYDRFVEASGIDEEVRSVLADLDPDDVSDLRKRGQRVRNLVRGAEFPDDLADAIADRYADLAAELDVTDPGVAVRSSATAEDLPEASFAGQQETFLNVTGTEDLLEAVRGCYASLFTDRAIAYREENDFDHFDVKLAAIVQQMGRADAAGVAFTNDPDSGFDDVVVIEGAYGLGELVVQGEVTPDRYTVFEPTGGIVERDVGEKSRRMVVRGTETEVEEVPPAEREVPALDDERIRELATYAGRIEAHYGRPMDVEWLVADETAYVVQARPETVHGGREKEFLREYHLDEEGGDPLLTGVAVGNAIGDGTVRVMHELREMDRFEDGDVLVTEMTDPDWVPVMRSASAIVTERGGKTSHAAIVSRELGVPAVVGAANATRVLRDGEAVTVDCTSATGKVYEGHLDYAVEEHRPGEVPDTETDVMLVLGDPDRAFALADLPVDGVGLAREEFIVTSHVGAHPLHLLARNEGKRFVDALRTGIAKIAAAFYPDPVVVRLSDFKTDEYRNLEGGRYYEPEEANPMLGWRGASRYYDERFRDAFELECTALRQVREDVGLDNVVVMVPFCRTPGEGEQVLDLLGEFGLPPDEVPVYVMAELPSNVVLADEFAERFDGFSVGSNDLTQLVLGVDRNSARLAHLFDEADPAVEESIRSLVADAHDHDVPVGICGDAPSTVPGYVEFLLDAGIDSISVAPDVAVETLFEVAEYED